jgi:hypothetical protein
MKFDSLKIWKQILLVNAAAVAGVITSLFAAPPNTPAWRWAAASSVAILALNCLYLRYRWLRKHRPKIAHRSRADTILKVLFPLYLLYVILSYYFYHQ